MFLNKVLKSAVRSVYWIQIALEMRLIWRFKLNWMKMAGTSIIQEFLFDWKGRKIGTSKISEQRRTGKHEKSFGLFLSNWLLLEFCKYSILKISKQNVKDLIKKKMSSFERWKFSEIDCECEQENSHLLVQSPHCNSWGWASGSQKLGALSCKLFHFYVLKTIIHRYIQA